MLCCILFFKQKTAYDMRISDWSSDVCSSDLDDTALTLSQKGRGNPFDPANYGEIVKPGELVDIVELSPLTLADRRIYNLLIANAWERISEPVIHRIAKTALKGTHQGNE